MVRILHFSIGFKGIVPMKGKPIINHRKEDDTHHPDIRFERIVSFFADNLWTIILRSATKGRTQDNLHLFLIERFLRETKIRYFCEEVFD